jgi:hypothetical protein
MSIFSKLGLFWVRFNERMRSIFKNRWAKPIAFLLIAGAVAVILQHEVIHLKALEGEQADRTYVGCVRINTILASDNRSNFADYIAFSASASLIAKDHSGFSKYTTELENSAKYKTWTPLVKCSNVTYHYKIPRPVSFTIRKPPAKDLLVLGAPHVSQTPPMTGTTSKK